MHNLSFRALIDQICDISNIGNPEALYEKADLDIDGVKFTLMDGGTGRDEAVLFYCEFGMPPAESREKALQRLLEFNFAVFKNNAPRFSVDPNSGMVLLMGRIPYIKVRAQDMLDRLGKYSAQAMLWRKTFYLEEGGSAPGVIQNSTASPAKNRGLARAELSGLFKGSTYSRGAIGALSRK